MIKIYNRGSIIRGMISSCYNAGTLVDFDGFSRCGGVVGLTSKAVFDRKYSGFSIQKSECG